MASSLQKVAQAVAGHVRTGNRHAASCAPMNALARAGGGRPPAAVTAPLLRAALRAAAPLSSRQQRQTLCSAAATEAQQETYTYQAEVDRLMDLIVNSLYSNRDVFLRELVSNASDALDKIRLLAVQHADEYKSGSALEIRIKADKEAKTITIEDTGVGMTREELLSSLGTIARSGTAKFMEAMREKHDANLIGQFGVGFYSAFLVADRVTVQTKNNQDEAQWVWESTAGAHSYTIRQDDKARLLVVWVFRCGVSGRGCWWWCVGGAGWGSDKPDLARGTRITLHLKPDAEEFADPSKLQSLIKQYSEFISFPIKLWSTTSEPVQVPSVTKTEWRDKMDWRVQNDNKPLWTKSPKEVAKEEYNAFFKTTFREFLDPLAVSHFNVEGTLEFSGMLFVPAMAPFEQANVMQAPRNIRLYVKRVFISDEFDEDLLPRYLSFVKGVVDSSDLPLNENRIVRAIRKQLVKRSLDAIAEMMGREDKKSSAAGDGFTTLAEYVGRKKEGQKAIYYLAADSKQAAESTPYVEALVRKGYEVLYLTEPIDEPMISNLPEFEGLQLSDVSREDLQLDESEEDKKALEEAKKELQPLTDYIKKALGDKVERVEVSHRLTDSPAIVVASKFGWSANMERIMRAQALGDARAAEYMRGRRILEINPTHPVIQELKRKVELESREAREQVQLLFEAASLVGGFAIDSPRDFAARIYASMLGGAGGASSGGAVREVDAEVV
eukprot:scaffold12.g8257.t1